MRGRFGVSAFALALLTLAMHPARAETVVPLTCNPGDYVVGIGGRVGNWVNQIYPICAHFNSAILDFNPSYPGVAYGDNGGAPQEDRCAPRHVVVHIETRLRNDAYASADPKIALIRRMQYVAFSCAPVLPRLGVDPAHHGISSSVPEDGDGGPDPSSRRFSDCTDGQIGTRIDAVTFPYLPGYQSPNLNGLPDFDHDPYPNPYPSGARVKCGLPPETETVNYLPPGAKVNTDFYGSDIPGGGRMQTNDPNLCYNLCKATAGCAGWTYVRPGVQGRDAVCYLKNPVPAASKNDCCISGIIIAMKSPLTTPAEVLKLRLLHP